ncbi:Nn.00g008350.m01.CDS01 [Neocucurbitaria sp. VM-36]
MELKKRLNLGSLMRKRSSQDVNTDPNADTPEANAARGVRLFCESGAANSGEEVLHLPTIVESAVASPTAAAAAAQQIRKFLSKENYNRPHVQYNAVMLIRILADNPGQSFTKNLDKQFADTVKHLLRNGQDPSVSQIVRESLDAMEREKAYDTNLNTLFAMWRKEKGLMANAAKQFGPRKLNAPGWSGSQQIQGGFSSGNSRSSSKTLPPPAELAGRIEEARTSAKLLLQLVQSTPPSELLGNELVKEFAERCTAAQRSVQGYISCDNPAPDDDTMLTLIETNEQLSLAASKHQRAVLQARRLIGASPSPPVPHSNNMPAGVPPQVHEQPSLPPRDVAPSMPPLNAATTEPSQPLPSNPMSYKNDELPLPPSLQAGSTRQRPTSQEEDPFADHYTSSYTPPPGPPPNPRSNGYGASPDPYHPGYQSTPSYLGRQESSANNLTMHGAQQSITEEDEHTRQYPGSERPRTPELNVPQQQQNHDVSPIAERNTVTYRY